MNTQLQTINFSLVKNDPQDHLSKRSRKSLFLIAAEAADRKEIAPIGKYSFF